MKENHNLENERAIVCRAQSGDVEALNVLLMHYQKLSHYIALKICHNDADAEDIVQESFIEVQRSIKNLNEPAYFKAWLNRIIFSKATKLFRKQKEIVLSDDNAIFIKANQEQRRYMVPDKNMKFESDLEVLRHCIDALPEKFSIIIYLKYFEQMSIQEMSYACDIPEGTVKSRLNYARKQLKTIVEEYEANSGSKLDFLSTGLETALISLFAKEAAQYLPFIATPKGFSFSIKGHVIEPSMVLFATLGTVATVGAAAIVYPMVSDIYSPTQQNEVRQDIVTPQEKSSFPPTVFQNETIESEKSAYQALTLFAHCEVELEELDELQQADAKNLYEVMEQHGGAYFELLKNRNYYK